MKIQTTNSDEEKATLVQRHDIHLKNAELARKALQEDKILATENPERYFTFSFDLQKALSYPKLSVSIAYYKWNMYVLNEGFHNFHDGEKTVKFLCMCGTKLLLLGDRRKLHLVA